MDRDRPDWCGPGLIRGHNWGEHSPEGAFASTRAVMGGPTTKCLFQDLRVLQQPTAEHQQLISFAQPQSWPNQEPAAQPGPEDDDLEDDDLGANEPLDEPGEEVEASRSEPSDALKAERRQTNQLERELRTIKRQLAQFSKINPDQTSSCRRPNGRRSSWSARSPAVNSSSRPPLPAR